MCSADGRLLFKDCIDVIHLPEEERTRKGSRMEIKYLKGKSDVLTFRNRATYYDPLAAVPNLSDLIKSKAVSKKVPKSIKQYIGKGSFLFKTQCRRVFNRKQNKIGDKILIRGQLENRN
jgi:UPF0176 protein